MVRPATPPLKASSLLPAWIGGPPPRAISKLTVPLPTIAAGQAASAPPVVWFSSWPSLQAGTPAASTAMLRSMPILAQEIAGMCRPSRATTLLARRTEIGARFAFGRALGWIEALKLVLTVPTST